MLELQTNLMTVVNAILNTSEFAKMVHPDFFGEDGGRNSCFTVTLTKKINDSSLLSLLP